MSGLISPTSSTSQKSVLSQPGQTRFLPKFSLRCLVPLSPSALAVISGGNTHTSYWQLSESDRQAHQRELMTLANGPIPSGGPRARQYEAQQPPFYYSLMSPVYISMQSASLPTQVLVLRMLNVAIASSLVFIVYGLACLLLPNSNLALLLSVLLTSLPGFFISVCRVGNDALAAVLSGLVLLMLVRATRAKTPISGWLLIGLILAAALLTKVFALLLLPLLPLAVAFARPHWKANLSGSALALFLAMLLSGAWYWQVWSTTGTLSGEQIDIAASLANSSGDKRAALTKVNWPAVIDSVAFTHIWIGGWSFLILKKWMYRIFESIALLGLSGVAVHLFQQRRFWLTNWHAGGIILSATFYLSFCAAIAYHALMVYLVQGISTGLGWYLYGALAAELVLLAVGFVALFGQRARSALAVVCVLSCTLDLYTTQFLLMPYYSGLSAQYPPGQWYSANLMLMLNRLSVNEPGLVAPWVVAISWAAYLCATVTLVIIAFRLGLPLHEPPLHLQPQPPPQPNR